MRLQRLTLQHFRNYESLDLDLSGGALHLFIGQNGSGKTNLLEAVSLLSLGQSSRAGDEEELAQFGAGHYRVRCAARADDGESIAVEVVCEIAPRRRKGCFVNDVRVGASALVGRIPSVLFLPEDMQLFSGAPAGRRRFLDQLLSQVSPSYLAWLSEYQRIVRQRNVLLKEIAAGRADASQLDIWDRALSEPGASLTVARLALIETLNMSLLRELDALGLPVATAEMRYSRKGEAREEAALREEMLQLLAANRDRDVLLAATSVGPHRDDWQILTDDRDIAAFASRGQQRVSMVALLLLQVSYLELQTGERPLVLLDDVFSELDDERQEQLVSALGRYQVLLTGTHLPPVVTGASLWSVEAGRIADADAKNLPQRVTLTHDA